MTNVTMQLKLPEAEAAAYAEQLRTATPSQLALARHFQQLAFADRGTKTFAPGFIPAPLYIHQAMAVAKHGVMATQLVNLVASVAEGH